jgi:FKBP-type peptidyl-prolyl cis-trans isomerase FkpA
MSLPLILLVFGLTGILGMHPVNPLWIQGGAVPSNADDKPFYALGINIARQVGTELKTILTPDEMAIMIEGYADSMKSSMGDAEEKKVLQQFGPALNDIVTKRAMANLEKRKSEGKTAIDTFKKDHKDTVTTDTGLVYWEEVQGTGKSPTAESTVEVHYHGTLTDGTVFDSSKLRGQSVQFPLSKVIKGWSEGVLLMKEGGKATLMLPAELAYGDGGSPPQIPGGSTLQFEIELISVVS